MDRRDYITFEMEKRDGQPCVRGMRITVYAVLDHLADGMSIEEFLEDFPDLTRDDIRTCFAFAADQGRRVRGAGVRPPFDQILSPTLVRRLEDLFAGATSRCSSPP